MKVVQSEGGPLIGLDRNDLTRWSGIDRKNFFHNEIRFADDYDALISIKPIPADICKISRDDVSCILITMPLETAIISVSETCIRLAQVEYADADWGFARVTADYFKRADFSDSADVVFSVRSCEFMFFDAALPGDEIGDDYLSFPLSDGIYRFRNAEFVPDDQTGLLLYEIIKIDDRPELT